jgi:hypothetical protein
MLNLRPYLLQPISTLSGIASDPVESWMRFREQYAAHREKFTPPDLYLAEENWEFACALLELSSPGEIASEFWDLWPKVIKELDAKGIQAGPESFKGWNDGDAGFVRAIWCLVRCLRPRRVIETGVAHGLTSRFLKPSIKMAMAISGVLIGRGRERCKGRGKACEKCSRTCAVRA